MFLHFESTKCEEMCVSLGFSSFDTVIILFRYYLTVKNIVMACTKETIQDG